MASYSGLLNSVSFEGDSVVTGSLSVTTLEDFPVDGTSITINNQGKLTAVAGAFVTEYVNEILPYSGNTVTVAGNTGQSLITNSLIDNSLTPGRVVYVGSSNELKDKSTLQFNETTDELKINKISTTSGTTVEIANASGQSIRSKLVYGDTLRTDSLIGGDVGAGVVVNDDFTVSMGNYAFMRFIYDPLDTQVTIGNLIDAMQGMKTDTIMPRTSTTTTVTNLTVSSLSGMPTDSTLTVSGGQLKVSTIGTTNISDGAVTTAKIADLNVTTAKIADLNVTTAKIADLNVTTTKIADNSLTTAKYQDNSITSAKIVSIDGNKINDPLTVNTITSRTTSDDLTISALGTKSVVFNSLARADQDFRVIHGARLYATDIYESASGTSVNIYPYLTCDVGAFEYIKTKTLNGTLTIETLGTGTILMNRETNVNANLLCQNTIMSNTISALTTNNDLRLSGNGTGLVSLGSRALVGITTATAPTPTTALNVNSSTQNSARVVLSGQEFNAAANTSNNGVAFLLGVNRNNNRQLWIGDSANLTVNSTNPVIRILPNSNRIDCVATDGTTGLQLNLGSSSTTTNVNYRLTSGNGYYNARAQGQTITTSGGSPTVVQWVTLNYINSFAGGDLVLTGSSGWWNLFTNASGLTQKWMITYSIACSGNAGTIGSWIALSTDGTNRYGFHQMALPASTTTCLTSSCVILVPNGAEIRINFFYQAGTPNVTIATTTSNLSITLLP